MKRGRALGIRLGADLWAAPDPLNCRASRSSGSKGGDDQPHGKSCTSSEDTEVPAATPCKHMEAGIRERIML